MGRVLIRTGTAEDAGDLHELDGLLRGIHFDRCEILGSFFRRRKKIERESRLIDGVVVVKQVARKWMSSWKGGLPIELFALVGVENQSLAQKAAASW